MEEVLVSRIRGKQHIKTNVYVGSCPNAITVDIEL